MLKRILLLCLVLATIFSSLQNGSVLGQKNDGDVLEGEEDTNLEDEGPLTGSDVAGQPGEDGDESSDDESEVKQLKPHPDADTHFVITKPTGMGLELPAGKDVHFLVGFTNKGDKDFLVETMDASFRYAMDFSFHLQNFTAIAYNRLIKPSHEATLSYSFFVSEAYSTRPYGFTVNLFYKDAEGNQYMTSVFNETVQIVELDEGLDGETFFLYLFLGALVILVLVGAQQLLSSLNRKRSTTKPKVEMGTTNHNDVDFDWLPRETIQNFNKSPKAPKQSPRQRRVKRGTGSADD